MSDKKGAKEGGEVQEDSVVHKEVDLLSLLYGDKEALHRVQTLELESVTMKTIARELRMRLDRHLQSQTKIISHLNLEIKKKDAKIEDLTENKEKLEQVRAMMKGKNSSDTQRQFARHEDDSKKWQDQIKVLRTEFDGMDSLLTAKIKLEQELEQVVEQLDREKRGHTVEIGELERRNVIEKERLKFEMLRKIRDTKLSLLAMTEDQLHTTTKRTIMENEQMTTELYYQSKETERIVKLNHRLTKENRSMRRQTELHQQAKSMLVKRAKKFQGNIKKLNDELTKQHKEDTGVLQQQQYSIDPARALVETKYTIAALEQRTLDLEDLVRVAQEETQITQNQLSDTRTATAQMLGVQNESLSFTLMCMEDVKLRFAQEKIEKVEPKPGLFPPIKRGVNSFGQGQGKGEGQNEASEASPNSAFFLDRLDTLDLRDSFLDSLITKFNSFAPEQQALLTTA